MVRKLARAIAAATVAGTLASLAAQAWSAAPGFELAALALHQETGRDIYLGGI